MNLKNRLVVYIVLNIAVIAMIVGVGHHLAATLESRIGERLRLGAEFRSVRKLHRLLLEEFSLTDDILLDPARIDLARYRQLGKTVEQELDSLEDLPPSAETTGELVAGRKNNVLYDEMLQWMAVEKPLATIEALRGSLQRLKLHSDVQVQLIGATGDRLRQQVDGSDVDIRGLVASTGTRVVGLCLLPFVSLVVLMTSFARRLSRQVSRLEDGFQAISDGNFAVRIGSPSESGSKGAISPVIESFDRTAGELEKLHRMKSQFYSMAVHDLRSPLSTMQLAIRALLDPLTRVEKRQMLLEALDRKVRQLLGLSDTLLDNFFLQSGKLEALRQRADVNELMLRCVDDLSLQAVEKSQSIAVERLAGESTLWCDPVKVGQVLENLLGNALKYSTEGGQIKLGASASGGETVLFRVEDNGPGIPEEDRRRIFEPFQRGNVGADGPPGHGLGLTICKQFVAAHGGSIWVESEVGKGSRFCFTIPRS